MVTGTPPSSDGSSLTRTRRSSSGDGNLGRGGGRLAPDDRQFRLAVRVVVSHELAEATRERTKGGYPVGRSQTTRVESTDRTGSHVRFLLLQIDHGAKALAGGQVGEGLVELVQRAASGHHPLQVETPGPPLPEQQRDVAGRVA